MKITIEDEDRTAHVTFPHIGVGTDELVESFMGLMTIMTYHPDAVLESMADLLEFEGWTCQSPGYAADEAEDDRDSGHNPEAAESGELQAIQLEKGKRYWTREGLLTEPLLLNLDDSVFPYSACVLGRGWQRWREDGSYLDSCEKHPCDLAREYVEPEPLQLEEGKRYWTRNGQLSPPLRFRPGAKTYRWVAPGLGVYADNGRWSSEAKGPRDLVREYVKPEGGAE